jgi:hypothetical protein
LGTGQSKTGAIHVVVGFNLVAGEQLFAVTAGDASHAVFWLNDADSADQGFTEDVVATNSGNVLASVWRLSNPELPTDSGAFVLFDGSDSRAIAVFKVSGLSASPFDVSSTGTGSSTTPRSFAATATVPVLFIGAIGTEGPDGDAAGTWDASAGDFALTNGQRLGTTTGGAASNVTISEGYRVKVNAIEGNEAAKINITSRDWAAAVASYKAKSGAPRRMIQVGNQRPQSFGLIKMLFAYNFEKHVFTRSK